MLSETASHAGDNSFLSSPMLSFSQEKCFKKDTKIIDQSPIVSLKKANFF